MFSTLLLQGVTPKMLEFMRDLRKVLDLFSFPSLSRLVLGAYILLLNPRKANPVEVDKIMCFNLFTYLFAGCNYWRCWRF